MYKGFKRVRERSREFEREMIPFSAAPPTKENKGRSLWLLVRAKLGLPIVVLSFSIFFLVGLFGSTLLSPAFPRERLTEVNGEVESEWPAMPYGWYGGSSPYFDSFPGMYKPAELWQLKDQCPAPKKRNCSSVFTLKEMEATSAFSDRNLIGKGGFGRVYKGVFRDGEVVAIKKMDLSPSKQADGERRVLS